MIDAFRREKSASAGMFGDPVDYTGTAFGSDAFFKSPLGRATEDVLEDVAKQIISALPVQYWQPRVAEAGMDTVIINGGKNVRVRKGDVFAVREKGREIIDPVTGRVIDTQPGPVVGRIKVVAVRPYSSYAVYVDGTARSGMFLEPLR